MSLPSSMLCLLIIHRSFTFICAILSYYKTNSSPISYNKDIYIYIHIHINIKNNNVIMMIVSCLLKKWSQKQNKIRWRLICPPEFHHHHRASCNNNYYSYLSSSSYSTSTSKNNNNNNNNNNDTQKITTPILIVGGGPTGLFLANLLRSYQVPFTLVEDQTTKQLFQHPQAHFLNTRSMELMKHYLPNANKEKEKEVYNTVRNAMPPVNEWKEFHFGTDMGGGKKSSHRPPMARVIHPVDKPIQSNQDSNGVLVKTTTKSTTTRKRKDNQQQQQQDNGMGLELSDCSVGHLAQHTFCKILYDAVTTTTTTTMTMENCKKKKNQHDDNDDNDYNDDYRILYNTRVKSAKRNGNVWTVTTDRLDNETINARIVVAADGAKSWWRKLLNIPMAGQKTIQHLVNVHFTITSYDDEFLQQLPPAMLYTIFSPKVLAMVVRHSSREYVMQIPYFAPYQTLDDDFTKEKVHTMLSSILGGEEGEEEGKGRVNFQIQSIRPWTMGSLVAKDYYDQNVFLVGDAAHVFPPAGGFGMNTGLQDVHNLAWRLALQIRNVHDIGRAYQNERQPVARQNAALSVRNYHRVLDVMNACYLNHQHPAALIKGLDASSFFIPLEVRRQTFQAALQAALWPLGQLKTSPDGFFARHVTYNLRNLLEKGQGLPLLFPNHEIGFRYRGGDCDEVDDQEHPTNDTFAKSPKLIQGGLFPHIPVVVDSNATDIFPRLCLLRDDESTAVTTRDLPAQLAVPTLPCIFCLLEISTSSEREGNYENQPPLASKILDGVQRGLNIPCRLAKLEVVDDEKVKCPPSTAECLNLQIDKKFWTNLNLVTNEEATDKSWVLIRPDGHVASIVSSRERNPEKLQEDIINKLVEGTLPYL